MVMRNQVSNMNKFSYFSYLFRYFSEQIYVQRISYYDFFFKCNALEVFNFAIFFEELQKW